MEIPTRFEQAVDLSTPLLRLFVYGSLKGGYDNYNRYCRGVRSIERTWIEGQLFQVPTGYPVLRLTESCYLARGTEDLSSDIALLQQFTESPPGRFLSRTRGRQGVVHGELLTFANPAARLKAIDGLEEFHAGRKSRYERVLIRVYSPIRQAEVPAWTYVAGDLSARGRLIPTGNWTS